MKSYKALLNSLSDDPALRQLTDEEVKKLRSVFIKTYLDLASCCDKNGLTVMLIGGTVIGAIRHKGFIPWDDDFDVAMPRADFERLKIIFDKELGDKYILSSPNYKNNANNRFPMMLVKDTLFVEAGNSPEDEVSKIKIDIFIIENIPDNPIRRIIKGIWCTALMAMGSFEETYEHKSKALQRYMCKTAEGRKAYAKRMRLGRMFSFIKYQSWMNIIDSACRFDKKTGMMGIPSGRGHYFGEIRPAKTFLPTTKGQFEGMEVQLPGDPNDYLSNLYGADYMTLPPKNKRERHFFVDIKFKEDE